MTTRLSRSPYSMSDVMNGPVAWMSPEALSRSSSSIADPVAKQVVSKSGDVYMLGGLLFEILTGTGTACV